MSSASLRVIIIGAGIGGLCLAQALKTARVRFDVYERNSSATDWLEGYQINVNPMGSKALHACLPPELWEAFTLTAGKPAEGLGFLTEQMQELLLVNRQQRSEKQVDNERTLYPISRIALRHMLLTGLDEDTHYGKTFVHYEQSDAGTVTAFFDDGTSVTGDVLVAADGANSRVRRQYLPHATRLETDALTIGGKLSLNEQTRAWLPPQLSTRMNLIMPLKPHQMYTSAVDHGYSRDEMLKRVGAKLEAIGLQTDLLFHNVDDYVLWAFAAHRNAYPVDVAKLDGTGLRQLTFTMIQDWHPDLRRMVQESDSDSVSLLLLKTSTPIKPWQTTHVTLLGDAIHSMSPLAGMGANTALRDAHALALALIATNRGEVPLLHALSLYEAEMLECGFKAVRTSIQNTQRAISNNRLERLIGRAWLKLSNTFPVLQSSAFKSPSPTSEETLLPPPRQSLSV